VAITIDDAISALQAHREAVGSGDYVLVLSLTGSGLETVMVDDLALVRDDDGAVVEVRVKHPGLRDGQVAGLMEAARRRAVDLERMPIASLRKMVQEDPKVSPIAKANRHHLTRDQLILNLTGDPEVHSRVRASMGI
jgi:hypothetical protein